MKVSIAVLFIVLVGLAGFLMFGRPAFDLPKGETVVVSEREHGGSELPDLTSRSEILKTDDVLHSIPLEEIRQGCFGRDCIPSVDNPKYISASDADDLLPEDTVGIGLDYKGVERFYPFNMLVTREIVNDTVAGDALAVTYCPLCGTGVVFSRELDGKVFEFGVSGLLWQSNLLMYNRESNEEDISLWSQVLGESVLGKHTGTKLPVVRSDVVLYEDWREAHPNTEVLNTGRIGDPYGGDYYGVARQFRPSFNEATSRLAPTIRVLGVEVNGQYKAYEENALPVGTTNDTFAGETIRIEKSSIGEVEMFIGEEPLSFIGGMWFSWEAVHPETDLYQ